MKKILFLSLLIITLVVVPATSFAKFNFDFELLKTLGGSLGKETKKTQAQQLKEQQKLATEAAKQAAEVAKKAQEAAIHADEIAQKAAAEAAKKAQEAAMHADEIAQKAAAEAAKKAQEAAMHADKIAQKAAADAAEDAAARQAAADVAAKAAAEAAAKQAAADEIAKAAAEATAKQAAADAAAKAAADAAEDAAARQAAADAAVKQATDEASRQAAKATAKQAAADAAADEIAKAAAKQAATDVSENNNNNNHNSNTDDTSDKENNNINNNKKNIKPSKEFSILNKIGQLVTQKWIKDTKRETRDEIVVKSLSFDELKNQEIPFSCSVEIYDHSAGAINQVNPKNLIFTLGWSASKEGKYITAVSEQGKEDDIISIGQYNPQVQKINQTYIDLTENFNQYEFNESNNIFDKWNSYVKTHGIKVTLDSDCIINHLWQLKAVQKEANVIAQPPGHPTSDPLIIELIGAPNDTIFYRIGPIGEFTQYTSSFIVKPDEGLYFYSESQDGVKSKIFQEFYRQIYKKPITESNFQKIQKSIQPMIQNMISISDLFLNNLIDF